VRSIGLIARAMIARASSSEMVFPNGRIFVVITKLPTPNYQLPSPDVQLLTSDPE
jgi:hypothetical protein